MLHQAFVAHDDAMTELQIIVHVKSLFLKNGSNLQTVFSLLDGEKIN